MKTTAALGIAATEEIGRTEFQEDAKTFKREVLEEREASKATALAERTQVREENRASAGFCCCVVVLSVLKDCGTAAVTSLCISHLL